MWWDYSPFVRNSWYNSYKWNGNITATCKIIVVKTLDQTDDQPEKEPTKEPEKEPTGAITNGNVNNSNNKSDLSQGHKTNNSKKENITISKAKIKSAKKKNPQSP